MGRNEVALNIWRYDIIGVGLAECKYQLKRSEPTAIVTSNNYYIPFCFDTYVCTECKGNQTK